MSTTGKHSQGIMVSEPQGLTAAYVDFKKAYPDYGSTKALDELRAAEYARLDQKGVVYLDYTGGGLYADSQIRQHMALLRDGLFGNPHSTNAASEAATLWVERVRAYVLEFFNASPDEYVAIFTSNATAAIKLVGESYPFGPGDRYLLTFDNHNSVNGIREFARSKGAPRFTYVPVIPPELRVDERSLRKQLDMPGGRNLFAYPAQSNLSGVQFSLEWIAEAQSRGWDVLLDCAAFVPTNRLDLGRWHPDFVDHVILQALRLPHWRWVPFGSEVGAGKAIQTMVRRGYHHDCLRAGGRSSPGRGRGGIRRGHGQLSFTARGGVRPQTRGLDRSGNHTQARRLFDELAAT